MNSRIECLLLCGAFFPQFLLPAQLLTAVAFFFTEDAAAIFLHIKLQFPRFVLSLPKAYAEIAIEEGDAVFLGSGFSGGDERLVFLVRTDQKRRAEGIKLMFRRIAGRLLQAHLIAIKAAVLQIVNHSFDKAAQAVSIVDDQRQMDRLGIGFQRRLAAAVFCVGMNIGIEPVGNRLNAISAQAVHTIDGAGGAAGVQ